LREGDEVEDEEEDEDEEEEEGDEEEGEKRTKISRVKRGLMAKRIFSDVICRS
jgi:hypothetical protein